MRPLSRKEIDRILGKGRILPEQEVAAILDEFQEKQPEMCVAIYGEPPDAIAEENSEMAGIYMELCFHIIWIYRSAFGNPPVVPDGEKLVLNALSLLDLELKSLSDDVQMEDTLRSNLQKRFIRRAAEAGVQIELLEYLDREVRKYASFKRKRRASIDLTNIFLFMVVHLMDELYNTKKGHA
jgi:hypothetical protein